MGRKILFSHGFIDDCYTVVGLVWLEHRGEKRQAMQAQEMSQRPLITKLKSLYFIWRTTEDLNIGRPNNPVFCSKKINPSSNQKQEASEEAVVTVQAKNNGLTKAFPVGMERKKQI